MRRTAGVVAALLLVGGLAGCGQDNEVTADEQFCAALAELESDVATFDALVESDASVDELNIQAVAIAASAKNLSADTQRLDDQLASDSMNAAQLELQAAIDAIEAQASSAADAEMAVTAAVDQYAATAQEVSTQVGCTPGT